MSRVVSSAFRVAVTTACATAGAGSESSAGPGRARINTIGSEVENQLAGDGPAAVQAVPITPDQVWVALPGVCQALGITGSGADPSTRTYGNRKLLVRRSLGGQALSCYLRSGTNATGMPVAEMHRIQLSVTTSVQPSTTAGSEIETEVSASGQSVEGTTVERVRCASTGALEARIAQLLGA